LLDDNVLVFHFFKWEESCFLHHRQVSPKNPEGNSDLQPHPKILK